MVTTFHRGVKYAMTFLDDYFRRISRIVMKQISCYLKGTIDFGLCFKGGIEDTITSQVHFE
jgi:hypothetical protein